MNAKRLNKFEPIEETKKEPKIVDLLDKDKKYPIVWAILHLENKQETWNIGICGYCWKPCFLGTDLEPLAVNDLYLNTSTGCCEESKRCLNAGCKYNRSTPEGIAEANNWPDSVQNQLKERWPNLKNGLIGFQKFADKCRLIYEQNPKVTVFEVCGGKGVE